MTAVIPQEPDPIIESDEEELQHPFWALLGVLIRILLFGACLAQIAVFAIAMLDHAYTPDLPWIIASGQHILETHALPTHDIFSWTHSEKPWVLYQWLFEVKVALGQQWLGLSTMMRLFIVASVGLYVLLPVWLGLRQRVPLLFSLGVASFGLSIALVNLSLRPLIVTSFFLAAQYVLLQMYRQQKIRLSCLIPVLALIYACWGNMHTGVILGFWSLGLMAVGDWVERKGWYQFTPVLPQNEGHPVSLKYYALLAAIAFVASLLNPYGFGIYAYLADLSSQSYLNNTITELQSPDFHLWNNWIFAGFMGLLMLMLTRVRRLFSLHEVLHLVVFTLASLFVLRFVVWMSLLYALILPKALYYWWAEASKERPAIKHLVLDFDIYKPFLVALMGLFVVLFLFFPKSFPPVSHGACEKYMKGLTAYQKLKLPSDRIFNDPEVGSCMLIVNPRQKVFVDTRFDFYGSQFTWEGRGVLGILNSWQKKFDQWRINTVVISKNWPLPSALRINPDYRKLYEDDSMIIFRKSQA